MSVQRRVELRGSRPGVLAALHAPQDVVLPPVHWRIEDARRVRGFAVARVLLLHVVYRVLVRLSRGHARADPRLALEHSRRRVVRRVLDNFRPHRVGLAEVGVCLGRRRLRRHHLGVEGRRTICTPLVPSGGIPWRLVTRRLRCPPAARHVGSVLRSLPIRALDWYFEHRVVHALAAVHDPPHDHVQARSAFPRQEARQAHTVLSFASSMVGILTSVVQPNLAVCAHALPPRVHPQRAVQRAPAPEVPMFNVRISPLKVRRAWRLVDESHRVSLCVDF